jgi:hypothetical protein
VTVRWNGPGQGQSGPGRGHCGGYRKRARRTRRVGQHGGCGRRLVRRLGDACARQAFRGACRLTSAATRHPHIRPASKHLRARMIQQAAAVPAPRRAATRGPGHAACARADTARSTAPPHSLGSLVHASPDLTASATQRTLIAG